MRRAAQYPRTCMFIWPLIAAGSVTRVLFVDVVVIPISIDVNCLQCSTCRECYTNLQQRHFV